MKKLLVLFLLLLGLGAFVYFYEIEGEEAREAERAREASLLRLGDAGIQRIDIKRAEETIILERSGESWILQGPIQAPADENQVNALISALEEAKRDREFEAEARDLDEYGLGSSRLELTVQTEQGTRTLYLGEADFSGANRYARFPDESKIYLTGTQVFRAADKPVSDWRDKQILAFNSGQVSGLTLRREDQVLEFSRNGEEWKMVQPVEEPAEQAAVQRLLTSLETATARAFIDQPGPLAEYGLAQPAVEVSLTASGKSYQIQLGAQTDSGYYARDPRLQVVWVVSESLYSDLTQDLWAFRSKEVVDVEQDEVAWVSIRRPDDELTIRREEFRWIVEKPEAHKDKEIGGSGLWYPLSDIEFESIDEQRSSFGDVDIEVVITLTDGNSRSYQFLHEDDQYRARQAHTGRSGSISAQDYEKLLVEIEDLL